MVVCGVQLEGSIYEVTFRSYGSFSLSRQWFVPSKAPPDNSEFTDLLSKPLPPAGVCSCWLCLFGLNGGRAQPVGIITSTR